MYVLVFSNMNLGNMTEWADDENAKGVGIDRRSILRINKHSKIRTYKNDNDKFCYLFDVDDRLSEKRVTEIWGSDKWLTYCHFITRRYTVNSFLTDAGFKAVK